MSVETRQLPGASWKPIHEYGDIACETDGRGIAKITICRPRVRNAFRPETTIQLIDAFARVPRLAALARLARRFTRGGPSKATFRASPTSSTKTKVSFERTLSGTSSRSFSLRRGRITVRIPARWAPSTFSFTPPTGRTRPRRLISPVIATRFCTLRPVSRDTRAV